MAKLTKRQYFSLWQAMCTKFEENNEDKQLDRSKITNCSVSLSKDLRPLYEKEGMPFDVNYLYKKYRKAEKESEITIKDAYLEIYLKYIDQKKIPDIEIGEISSPDTSPLLTHYHAFFYSYRNHEIKEFDLKYDIKKGNSKLYGLHDDKDLVFNGKLQRYNGHIHFSFIAENRQNFFTVTGYVVEKDIQNRDVIRAMASTVSTNGFLMYFEVVLIKKEHLSPQRKLNISRYLMLKRPTYRVQNQEIDHTSQLSVQKKRIDEITHMIGTYRVWYFGSSNSIYQSKLVIDDTYRGFHYSGFHLEEEKDYNLALLKITRVGSIHKLVITTHPAINIGTIAQSMIEIPKNKSDRLLEGSFCNIDGFSASIVLYKESDSFIHDSNSFKIGKLEETELNKILKEELPHNTAKETYIKVYNRLKKLNNY